MQLYVDHFSKDLKGLISKLGYFEKLGVNFLHLMPITPRPKDLISGRATMFIEAELELTHTTYFGFPRPSYTSPSAIYVTIPSGNDAPLDWSFLKGRALSPFGP